MTTAYAAHTPQSHPPAQSAPLRLITNTAPARGPDAAKMVAAMPYFHLGTAVQGQSVEAISVFEAVKKLQLELSQHIEGLRARIQNPADFSYNHVPIKPAFSVHATYKHIGKLKPRQFPIDE